MPRPDPFTEIREALDVLYEIGDADALESRGAWKLSKEAEAARAALDVLEREAAERAATAVTPTEAETAAFELGLKQGAAERETALKRWPDASTEVAYCLRERKCIELRAAEARVREVEAERDGNLAEVERLQELWSVQSKVIHDLRDDFKRQLRLGTEQVRKERDAAEATVARQAEALTRYLNEAPDHLKHIARAVLASPEAPAAEPTVSEWMREAPTFRDPWKAAALPAVDAPPEPTT